MGMLATVINALALQGRAERTASRPHHDRDSDAEVADRNPPARGATPREGRVVILAAGTGNPTSRPTYRPRAAVEIEADVILKGPGGRLYTADPKRDPNAVKLAHLGYLEVLNRASR